MLDAWNLSRRNERICAVRMEDSPIGPGRVVRRDLDGRQLRRTPPQHEACLDFDGENLVLRSGRSRRLEGWPRVLIERVL